ncbi:MAG: peptide chain release factor N(5)-glutamine methyltransferase [Alphaproteobacteria bacterium]|nr:peptide chain release factor N(5)-glutamine methyltransferase [Alphaproteobacteria bacterium]
MTIKELLDNSFKIYHDRQQTIWLFETVFDVKFKNIIPFEDDIPQVDKISFFLTAVGKLKDGIPLERILQQTEFCGLEFLLNNETLVPRHETEGVVDIVKSIYDYDDGFSFLDLGSGSGNIPVSILSQFPNATATAVEISKSACVDIFNNAFIHGIHRRLKIKNKNMFDINENEKFDLIVSNPPYIKTADCNILPVKFFDPLIALDGGKNGLEFYDFIFKNIMENRDDKIPNIILEISPELVSDVLELTERYKINGATIEKDLFKRDRFLVYKNN